MTPRDDLEEAAEQWRTQGWVLIKGLVPAAEVAAGLVEIPDRDDVAAVASGPALRSDVDQDDVRFRNRQFDGTTLFPYPRAPNLNRLMVHPAVRSFAHAALDTQDLRIYQARIWSKYGDHTNYAQPHHVDRNHSLVPIRQGPGWGHLECFLYLHDTDASTGAPMAVPASVAGRNGLGIGDGLGGAGTIAHMPGRDEAPELYAGEVQASGPAGSLFAYRSDVWHRGVDIAPGAERHILGVSFRPSHVDWIGFDAIEPMVNRPDFITFAQDCTPEELALFGVPRPGHDFWNSEVLDAMQRIYPGLDLEPWRAALA